MSISVLDPLDSPLRGPWYRHCFLLFSLRFYFSQFIFEKSNLAYYLLFPKQTHFSALISIIFSNLSTKKSGLLPNPLQRKNMMLKWLYQKLSLRFFPAPFIRKKNQVLLYIVQIHLPKQTHFSAPISVIFSSLSTENRLFSFTVNVIEKT